MHPLLEWIVDHIKLIATIIGALILAAVLLGGWNWYQGRVMDQARQELGVILTTTSGQEKLDRLEALAADAPAAMRPALLLEQANAAMQAEDYAAAAGFFEQLRGEGDENVELLAALGQAKNLMLADKPAEAYALLKDLAGTAPEAYTAIIFRQLAAAAEAAGETQAALDAYHELAGIDSQENQAYIEYKINQLNRRLNQS